MSERAWDKYVVAELVEERKEIAEAIKALDRKDANAMNFIAIRVKQLYDTGKSIEEIYQESNLPFRDLAIYLRDKRFEEATGYAMEDHPDWYAAI